ncbi:hypothetical protein ADL15_38800 [Actinoplanes awajinensis subsp. mycoplanecinus]|uniref:Lipoprotein n=1 Tax=Actinoplanes awajinensis subsp. mycoplanecinus TaxID=135947 RepID=A0A101JGH3_9ACTN|nr:hypothetical protein ADL15_38800 [Actinoplanes awajinensis subsp. mycoplanecinus]
MAALAVPEILERAEQALTAAKSYHLAGQVIQDGQPSPVDLKKSGGNTLLSTSRSGMTLQLLTVDGQTYFRADEKLLASLIGPELAERSGAIMAKSWMKPPAGDRTWADLASEFRAEAMLASLKGFTKGGTKVSNGHPVVVLQDPAKKGILYVATTGEPYPLKMGAEQGVGSLLFTEFGADFPEIKAPAANEILQLPARKK